MCRIFYLGLQASQMGCVFDCFLILSFSIVLAY
jgi:hypothetical protein